MTEYDAVVVGLGGMGSATIAHLAARGQRVLGLEQFARGHELGASTGRSRIIRMAYYEDPAYVPLLRRAYDLWAALERDAGVQLFDRCGILMAGGPHSAVLAGATASARLHGIALETLTPQDVKRRFPALLLRDDERVLFEPNAGMVFPEAAVDAQLRVAERAGAELRFATCVAGIASHASGITLELDTGPTVHAQRLAICAGPWLGSVARRLGVTLRTERNVQLWWRPSAGGYERTAFPAFFLDRSDAPAALYGFPDYGLGVKAALHGSGAAAAPDELDRIVHAADIEPVAALLDAFMPGAAGTYLSGKACLYALTPDEHFVIDRDPGDARIVVAGGFSGHGFKFCPVVGEIVADLVTSGETHHPIGFLALSRFGAQSTPSRT